MFFNRNVIITDFNLQSFLHGIGSELTDALDTSVSDILLEQLGVLGYFGQEQCERISKTYTPAINGWKSGKSNANSKMLVKGST